MLPDGRYCVAYNNENRIVGVKLATRGALKGKVILSLLMNDGKKWRAIASLNDDNSIQFFKAFAAENPQALERIRWVVDVIALNPERAKLLFEDVKGNLA